MIANLHGTCFDDNDGMRRRKPNKRRDCSVRIRRVRYHWQRSGVHCAYCHRWLSGREVTVDHIWPLSWGGGKSMQNYAPACGNCQKIKKDRFIGNAPWPHIGTTKRTILACLAVGRCPWSKIIERRLPVGVLIYNEAIDRAASDAGFEPFNHQKPWWTLPDYEPALTLPPRSSK